MTFNPRIEMVLQHDDASNDRWHDGAMDCYRGRPKASEDKDYLDGWVHAETDLTTRVVTPVRPEGYYHMPVGTFD